MGYTYEDFMSQVNDAGMMNQFSQYDLDLARQYPEFGMGVLGLKKDYASATTPEQKLLANEAANALRKSYGYYSGGGSGSQYIPTGKWQQQTDEKLSQIGSFGSFSYDKAAPTYTGKYDAQRQQLLDSIINRPDFSWSKEADPQWSSYKKSYLREGERATADALGQASAASGGRPSSYAVNAATQAGDYYATKLNDVIPTLYQQAYDRYLKEFQMQQQALDAVNGQDQIDYNRYLTELGQYNTDRNFDYQAYLDDFTRLMSQAGAMQGEDDRQYGRYQDSVNQALQVQALEQQRQDAQKSFYQQQLDAILSAGGSPSAQMIAGSGYTNEYVQALENAYKQQQIASGGTSGGSKGGNGNRGGNTGDSGGGNIYQQLYLSGVRTEGDAYAALRNMGYNNTEAGKMAGYFGGMLDDGNFDGLGLKVDMNSVMNLGYGPIDEKKLSQLVDSGKVEQYQDGNMIRFRKPESHVDWSSFLKK